MRVGSFACDMQECILEYGIRLLKPFLFVREEGFVLCFWSKERSGSVALKLDMAGVKTSNKVYYFHKVH